MVGDDDRRMSAVRLRVWKVDADFPALTGVSIHAEAQRAIVGVNYSLDLTQLGEPITDDWDALTSGMGWIE
jgi:hypothetical protein